MIGGSESQQEAVALRRGVLSIGFWNVRTMFSTGMKMRSMSNLVIGGTLFTHKDILKITCNPPNTRGKSQIDHLLINGKWRRSFEGVRMRRDSDVGD